MRKGFLLCRNIIIPVILKYNLIFSGVSIFPHESLIFFDEIQSCERALTSLKYFAEESPVYNIIAAGSLLGVAMTRNQYSYPVGKVDVINMYSLDFEEYLWAINQKKTVNIIKECYEKNEACSIHQTLLDHYYKYIFIGGMPQVLNEFLKTNDNNKIMIIQKNILDGYLADMSKYASPSETIRIMAVYNSIAAQLAKENRKFQYKTIKTGARASQYENSVEWLKAAGIIIKCEKVKSGQMPLSATKVPSSFKIYMLDAGLLCSKFGISPEYYPGRNLSKLSVMGAIAENYVVSSLVNNGFEPAYWESDGKAEVDFIIQKQNGSVIPIEVKSSTHVRSKSLQQYVKLFNPEYSIRISSKNFGFENIIKSVPLYAVFCIS